MKHLYEELGGDDRVQIAFGPFHMKFISLETHGGHVLNVHGSANMRSSNSMEQIYIDQNKEIYRFNRDAAEKIAEKYGTIDYRVKPDRKKKVRDGIWQAALSVQDSGEQHHSGEAFA